MGGTSPIADSITSSGSGGGGGGGGMEMPGGSGGRGIPNACSSDSSSSGICPTVPNPELYTIQYSVDRLACNGHSTLLAHPLRDKNVDMAS